MNGCHLQTLAAAGLCALLTGCLTAPRPTDSATAWTPPAQAVKPDETWAAVRAQERDFSKPLTLAELTDLALRHNPATRVAWSGASAAAAQAEAVRGNLMPTLTASVDYDRFRTGPQESDFLDRDYARYGPKVKLDYLLINFGGGRKAAVEQAMETVYAADFAFNRELQDTILAVETAYYAVIGAQAAVEAAEASVKDARTTLDAAQERQRAGTGTELDVAQAQAGYDLALFRLADAQGQRLNASGALCLTIGAPADAPVQPVPPADALPAAIAEPDMQRLINDALARRPDVAALRAELAARRAAARVQAAALWPSLSVNGTVAHNEYDNLSEVAVLQRGWSYGMGLSLEWTFFDGLQDVSAKRAARAVADATAARLEQAELAASAEVWTRYHEYATALKKYESSAAYLKSASKTYDLALASYTAGLRSTLDLLNADSQLALARSQDIIARQEVFGALAQLAHATGLLEKGGSSQALDQISTTTGKEHSP